VAFPIYTEEEVAVNLRPTVSRPVCLGARHPSGTSDQFFFLLEISFRQVRLCYFVAPSLTRGRVCNLLYNCFWALPEKSLLVQSPTELTAVFYCLIWGSPNLEGQVPIFISPRNRVAQLHPGHWVPFCRLLRLAGLRWRYSNPPPHGSLYTLNTDGIYCTTRIQQFLYWYVSIHCCGTVFSKPLHTNFRLFWFHYSGHFCFRCTKCIWDMGQVFSDSFLA
jgi:hypothetical protein